MASHRRQPGVLKTLTAPPRIARPNTPRNHQRHSCRKYATSMLRTRWLYGNGMMKYTFASSNRISANSPT
jgi:hypothetical protein